MDCTLIWSGLQAGAQRSYACIDLDSWLLAFRAV